MNGLARKAVIDGTSGRRGVHDVARRLLGEVPVEDRRAGTDRAAQRAVDLGAFGERLARLVTQRDRAVLDRREHAHPAPLWLDDGVGDAVRADHRVGLRPQVLQELDDGIGDVHGIIVAAGQGVSRGA